AAAAEANGMGVDSDVSSVKWGGVGADDVRNRTGGGNISSTAAAGPTATAIGSCLAAGILNRCPQPGQMGASPGMMAMRALHFGQVALAMLHPWANCDPSRGAMQENESISRDCRRRRAGQQKAARPW